MTSISDLSNIILVLGQTLSTPLLSDLVPEQDGYVCDADYYDEEEGCTPCSLTVVVGTEELDEVSGDDSSQPSCWSNCWDVLHAILFLQLGKVLCMSGAEATATTCLHWTLVNYGIVLFFGIAIFYHKTVKDSKLTWTVVLLAPEILIMIIMGLLIFDQLVAAFLFMLGSIQCLAILLAVISI
jgi:surface polysaccharide O-acyltransferase-like enzyme